MKARNQETLSLMLQAERRDIPHATCLSKGGDPAMDPFHDCDTVVKFVATSIDFDEQCRGEIDAVGQEHFLRGRNFDPMMDPDYWDERDYYGENK
jgi:hypothetical protein